MTEVRPLRGEDPRDELAINTIRFLAVDMVEAARSGHPGAPLGQAALAYWLWTRHLAFDPEAPDWVNRDRFVLSCGHASALIYSLLHLSGYELSLDELKNFRQLGSKTPGHPEYGLTPGVETTTGPLGQGLANAVGMALAERLTAEQLNSDIHQPIDYRTWVIASDGDLMEGVTAEASSLAGHYGLGKLNVFWDANEISIEGSTDLTFTEDVAARYRSYGWHTLEVADGNDLQAIDQAIEAAKAETERPTLVTVRTHIGFGSPAKQDTADAHGAPLGGDEVIATKANLGWPSEPTFLVPDPVRRLFATVADAGRSRHAAWREAFARYQSAHPGPARELERRLAQQLPSDWDAEMPTYSVDDAPIATRKVSGAALNAVAGRLPELVGGSADLAGSNNTWIKDEPAMQKAAPGGRNMHYGVREHAMGSMMNGMALSGLLRPYGGTFLIFSDYMRPPIRLAALMELPCLYIFTHDSIFLGEDGPTHQPISQLAALRAIPNVTTVRPADANETVEAWRLALRHHDGPTALSLTRQKLPVLPGTAELAREGVARGGYVLSDPEDGEEAEVILIATGSEVQLAVEASQRLAREDIRSRVVSMPCWERFDAQDGAYRASVLPRSIEKRIAIEAGSPLGWHRYAGEHGVVLALEGFGASAPAADLARHFGFTADAVEAAARKLLGLERD